MGFYEGYDPEFVQGVPSLLVELEYARVIAFAALRMHGPAVLLSVGVLGLAIVVDRVVTGDTRDHQSVFRAFLRWQLPLGRQSWWEHQESSTGSISRKYIKAEQELDTPYELAQLVIAQSLACYSIVSRGMQ